MSINMRKSWGGLASGVAKPNPKKAGAKPPTLPGLTGMGWVTFASYGWSEQFTFTCLLGDTAPTVTDGYGGWQSVSRAKRRALVDWVGNNPLTIDIPIQFEGWTTQESQEAKIRQLEKMCGLEQGMDQPPFVTFDSGGVVPHDASNASHNDWVIADVKWGDCDRRADGDRVRQAATVTVMQYVADDQLTQGSSAQKARKRKRHSAARKRAQKGAHRKKYVIKDQETLETIAAKPRNKGGLGDGKRWRDIKKLNPKYRDPKKVLPMGATLNMP